MSLLNYTDLDNAFGTVSVVDYAAGVPTIQSVDLTNVTNVEEAKLNVINAREAITLRNNWGAPCQLEAYHLFLRMNSGSSFYTLWQEDMSNKNATSPTTNPLYNVRDGKKRCRKYYKVVKCRKYFLNAGEEVTIILKRNKPAKWNNKETTEYIKGITQQLLLRIRGVVSHDVTTTTLVGYQPVRLDYVIEEQVKVTAQLPNQFKRYRQGAGSLDNSVGGYEVSTMDLSKTQMG